MTFATDLGLKTRPALSLALAQEMAQACETRQIANKRPPVSIAIYDTGANLILFHRMTGTPLGATVVAMKKGKSTAHFPTATKQWSAAAYGKNGTPGIAHLPNITTITGGLPIMTAEGVHLGGIGVSGSSGSDDEACAQAGLDAVKSYLTLKPEEAEQ
ncbi:heme-binding protein [Porticoccaceae bacterium]|nr:heme-binding protein [Porticoccaceae bacterium]